MRRLAGLVVAGMLCVVSSAQEAGKTGAGAAVITFTYKNDKLAPSEYQMKVHEDGSGTYHSSDGVVTGEAKPFEQAITISEPLLASIFSTARAEKFFAISCEVNGGRLAFQGQKTLAYDGPDGHGSCTFNYSKNKQIQKLNDDLQGVASTVEAGHRLDLARQHDKLSLDAELDTLMESVKDGRSIDLQNIRPLLLEIAADPTVLNRARQRASLLASGKTH
jgi:hypothetical protein